MTIEIEVPKLSATMIEAKVLKWFKKPGDSVTEGELLVELETDKAALEVEASASGTLAEQSASEGETVAVGAVLAVLTAEGEAPAKQSAKQPDEEPAPAAKRAGPNKVQRLEDVSESSDLTVKSEGATMPSLRRPSAGPERAIKITPLARRLARHLGLDPNSIAGSGPRGRIMRRDLDVAPASTSAPVSSESPATSDVGEVTRMRQAIAAQVSESHRTIPAFTLDRWVELEMLEDARELLNRKLDRENGKRLTVTDLILQAMADVLPAHPKLLSSWIDGSPPRIERADEIAIGLVVALDDGLMIPVLHDLGDKGTEAISAQRSEAIAAAHGGRQEVAFLGQATISLSNIGKLGVDRFEAIISPGETAILAVGRVQERPVSRNGAIAVARGAHFTLSVDHRLIDGLTGAAFLGELADRIERQTWRL